MRLLVVGGGPAGLAAAMQARELGADVAEQVMVSVPPAPDAAA